jgi:small-conductance mechanosensitive channel
MNPSLLSTFLTELITDLRNPGVLWQVAALVVCIGLGWSLARALRSAFVPRNPQLRMIQLGVEGFSRVLAPLITLALIESAKLLLAKWHHVNLLRLAVPLIASLALIRFVFYFLRRVIVRQGTAGSALLLFEKLFALLVWSAFALYITGWWPDVAQYLDQTMLPIGSHKVSLSTIFQAVASVAVTLMLALWAGAALEDRLMQFDAMHTSMRVVMSRMVRAVLILLAVLASLSMVGIDLTVLSVFGGALGVGIGLGLQKIASNYVSGFVILLDRSLAIGDMITVDKYSGMVTQINTRYTVLQGMDGIESVIPNEMLVSSPVQNYSLSNSALRLSTHVTVGYPTDIDQILPLLAATTAGIERVSPEPPPNAILLRFGADGLDLEIGFWIADPENGRMNVVSEVNKAIWHVLKQQQVEIPYPQREIRIISNTKPA